MGSRAQLSLPNVAEKPRHLAAVHSAHVFFKKLHLNIYGRKTKLEVYFKPAGSWLRQIRYLPDPEAGLAQS